MREPGQRPELMRESSHLEPEWTSLLHLYRVPRFHADGSFTRLHAPQALTNPAAAMEAIEMSAIEGTSS